MSGAWIVATLAIPIYRTLPPGLGAFWTYGVLGLVVASVLLNRVGRPKWHGVWVAAGYGGVVAGISSSGNSGLAATMFVALQLFVILGLAPFALRGAILRDPNFLRRVSIAFVIVQTLSACAGVLQLLGVSAGGFSAIYGRSPGLAGHPNVLGLMASIAILLSTQALATRSGLPRGLVLVVLALNALGLISTGSLSAMFACAFGVIFVMVSNRIKVRYLALFFVLATAVGWALLQIPVVALYFRSPADRFLQVTGQTDDISTLGIRLKTYEAAWEYIKSDPFLGKGLDPANAGSYGVTAVHNIFLHSWYNGGIALALGISAILVAALVFVLQALRARRHGLAAGVVVTVLAYAFTSAMLDQAYYWLPVIAAWASLPAAKMKSPSRLLAQDIGVHRQASAISQEAHGLAGRTVVG
jgi:hypothetical protein